MILTCFNASGNSKVPYSPTNDKEFVFSNIFPKTNFEMFSALSSNWVLNIPLEKLEKATKLRRNKSSLEPYIDSVTYFILDIDKVYSEYNQDKVLEFFKDYKIILGKSKSYNGVDNFNLKGILFTEELSVQEAKLAIRELNEDLNGYCDVDEHVARISTFNAPMKKTNVFYNNEQGELYKFTPKDYSETVKKDYESFSEEIKEPKKLDDLEGDTLEDFCLNIFQTFLGFEPVKSNSNGSISFKHDSEKKSKGGFFWYKDSPFIMHHPNASRSMDIFEYIKKSEKGKKLLNITLDYTDMLQQTNASANIIHCDEQYLTVTPDKEELVHEFLHSEDSLFSIVSPMGTAKSTIINYCIEEAHDQDMKVLIITNRISVANDFSKKYNMKIYNKDIYNIGDSLICQINSLHKYDIRYFDLVVMDEFISLMMHSTNDKNIPTMSISKYFASFNKRLIIADAFLTGYENFLLNNKKNVYQLINEYRDRTVLYSYENSNYFMNSLLHHTKKHKITASFTSKSVMHSIAKILKKRGLKVITLDADTPERTKELIYMNFENEENDKWDVLLFSPTLTVGVSNLNNVYYHFHYDSSMSADVISSIQMIKRTRKAKEIHMFIEERRKFLKVTYNDLRDHYMNSAGKMMQENYLFDTDEYGNPRLSEIGKKALKIKVFNNIIEANHKQGMLWLMKYHFMKEPRVIDGKASENPISHVQRELKNDKKAELRANIDTYLTLNQYEIESLIIDGADSDNEKILKIMAEFDSEIKPDIDPKLRKEILEYALENKTFIQKCKYFHLVWNFSKGFYDESDVKHKISAALINNDIEDVSFYNRILKYGKSEIFDEYYPGKVKDDLKYILDKIGYKLQRTELGQRMYKVDEKVKEYNGFIK
jgi:hypothetical protein